MGATTYFVEHIGAATRRGLRSVGANTRVVGETMGGVRDVTTWLAADVRANPKK